MEGNPFKGLISLTPLSRRFLISCKFFPVGMAIHEVVIRILIPIAVGFLLRQVGLFGDDESAVLRKFVIYVSIPLLVFYSMYSSVLPPLSEAISMIVALPLMTLAFYLISLGVRRLVPLGTPSQTSLLASIAFGNYGWLGWSAAYTVFGAQGLNQALFFTLLWWPVFYGFGGLIGMGTRTRESISPRSVGVVTALPVSCIATGITLNLLDVDLPSFFLSSVESLGNTTIPLILVSVGIGLAAINLRRVLFPVLLVSGIRLGLGPIVGLLVSSILPVGDLGTKILILQSAMPVATIVPVLGDLFDMDRELVSATIVFSTVLSLGTLPLVLGLIT
jgi:predicted permease